MRSASSVRLLPLLAALLASSPAAAGPTFTVGNSADAPGGGNLADGVCETAPGNGLCTLRAAIMEANHVPGGGATIVLPAGTYPLAIPPGGGDGEENGDFDLLAPMTIVGEGPSASIVDGNDLDVVFSAAADAVTLQGLGVTHGGDGPGAIRNASVLHLENVAVSDAVGAGHRGIDNAGTLTIRHGVVANNGSSNGLSGGGIYNEATGTLDVADSAVLENDGYRGGGVYNAGTATIERSSVVGNSCSYEGAGVYNAGTLVMVDATVFLNQNFGSSFTSGGGLYSKGPAQLYSVTIADNSASANGDGGAGIAVNSNGGSVFLKNSIVSGNLHGLVPDECGGSVVDSGDYNRIGARSTCVLNGMLDHVNASDADPGLGTLASNGGFSVDAFAFSATGLIPAPNCTDPLGAALQVDGRGYARSFLVSPGCDIGANQAYANYAPDPLESVELLRNGGPRGNELGRSATDGSVVAAPYWFTAEGYVGQAIYGSPSAPSRGDAPANSGSSVFVFGGGHGFGVGDQFIDLHALAAEIDAGQLRYRAAGAFGGAGSDDDNATLTLRFADDFDVLGEVVLGGFTASDRGNATKLLRDSRSGLVPVGSRYVTAELIGTLMTGATNEAYADDVSLVVPEPSPASACAAALAALALAAHTGSRRGRGSA